jgi:hypothetical protein
MKLPSLRFVSSAFAAVCLTAAAFAPDPTGTWTSSSPGRNGGPPRTTTFKFAVKDGALTGSASGRPGTPDAAISAATFKDPDLAFTVERTFNDNKIVMKYTGKLDGDTITGSIDVAFGDQSCTVEWKATRSKEGAAPAPAAAP